MYIQKVYNNSMCQNIFDFHPVFFSHFIEAGTFMIGKFLREKRPVLGIFGWKKDFEIFIFNWHIKYFLPLVMKLNIGPNFAWKW